MPNSPDAPNTAALLDFRGMVSELNNIFTTNRTHNRQRMRDITQRATERLSQEQIEEELLTARRRRSQQQAIADNFVASAESDASLYISNIGTAQQRGMTGDLMTYAGDFLGKYDPANAWGRSLGFQYDMQGKAANGQSPNPREVDRANQFSSMIKSQQFLLSRSPKIGLGLQNTNAMLSQQVINPELVFGKENIPDGYDHLLSAVDVWSLRDREDEAGRKARSYLIKTSTNKKLTASLMGREYISDDILLGPQYDKDGNVIPGSDTADNFIVARPGTRQHMEYIGRVAALQAAKERYGTRDDFVAWKKHNIDLSRYNEESKTRPAGWSFADFNKEKSIEAAMGHVPTSMHLYIQSGQSPGAAAINASETAMLVGLASNGGDGKLMKEEAVKSIARISSLPSEIKGEQIAIAIDNLAGLNAELASAINDYESITGTTVSVKDPASGGSGAGAADLANHAAIIRARYNRLVSERNALLALGESDSSIIKSLDEQIEDVLEADSFISYDNPIDKAYRDRIIGRDDPRNKQIRKGASIRFNLEDVSSGKHSYYLKTERFWHEKASKRRKALADYVLSVDAYNRIPSSDKAGKQAAFNAMTRRFESAGLGKYSDSAEAPVDKQVESIVSGTPNGSASRLMFKIDEIKGRIAVEQSNYVQLTSTKTPEQIESERKHRQAIELETLRGRFRVMSAEAKAAQSGGDFIDTSKAVGGSSLADRSPEFQSAVAKYMENTGKTQEEAIAELDRQIAARR